MRIRSKVVLSVAVIVSASALAAGPAIATTYAQIAGSGSSWAASAMNQWSADVSADGVQVLYTANGSAQGRKDFGNVSTDFAVSELAYQGKDGSTGVDDSPHGRALAYVPVVGGSLAFTYHLEVDGHLVKDLRLSAESLAKIFTNQITSWDDAAITHDNGGRVLPSIPITPVVRADGSADTYALTGWLGKRFASRWASCFGSTDPTEYFPLNCAAEGGPQRAQSGADGVMSFIKSAGANGAIGYVPAMYPRFAQYPMAAVENATGRFVLPDARGTWAALRGARTADDGQLVPSSALDVADADAYPITMVAQLFVPTAEDDPRLTTAKRQSVVDFVFHALCSGQKNAASLGYGPLPINIVRSGLNQLSRLKEADSGVDLADRDLQHCDNPTFNQADGSDIPPGTPSAQPSRATITGAAKVGHPLRAVVVNAQGGVSYTYVWRSSGSVVWGATGPTYTPSMADIGRYIDVTITPHTADGAGPSFTSDSTGAVQADPVVTRRPTVKVTKAPTRKASGRLTVRVTPMHDTKPITGTTTIGLSFTLGKKKVSRLVSVRFTRGVGLVTVPKLSVKGRWRSTVTLLRSDLIKQAKSSKPFTVRVTK